MSAVDTKYELFPCIFPSFQGIQAETVSPQTATTAILDWRSARRNPLVMKTPEPIMFDMINAAALGNPSVRRDPLSGSVGMPKD